MVVYSRFADDDDTMLWLRFRARKRFRRQHLSIAQHRRWVAATGLCIGGGQGPCGRKRRELAHFSWEDHLLRLTEAEFKLRYRLNFDSFMDLLHILRADLVVSNEKQARFAKWGQLVLPEVKLAMALHFLAGGSPLDLKLIYHVSTSFVYDSIWLVVDAVNKHLKMELPLDDTTRNSKFAKHNAPTNSFEPTMSGSSFTNVEDSMPRRPRALTPFVQGPRKRAHGT